MAIDSTVSWEVRTTGNDNNGGGYSTSYGSNVDFSQQDSPDYSPTGLSTFSAGATTLIDGAAGFLDNHTGNVIQITGGTNFIAGFYVIVEVFTDTAVDLDRSPTPSAAGSGGTGNIGGALATPQTAIDEMVGGNHLWIKAGTYSRSTNTILPHGVATTHDRFRITGYTTTRGDATTAVAILNYTGLAGAPFQIGTSSSGFVFGIVENLGFTGGKGTGGHGVNIISRNCVFRNCRVYDVDYDGFGGGVNYGNEFYNCEVYNHGRIGSCCSTYGFRVYIGSVAIGCSVTASSTTGNYGFLYYHAAKLINCVAHKCYRGFYAAQGSQYYDSLALNCASSDCASHGFIASSAGAGQVMLINCISTNNGGWGFYDFSSGTGGQVIFHNFAHYGNTSGGINTTAGSHNKTWFTETPTEIILTENPFVDRANDDWRLKPNQTSLIKQGWPSNILMNNSLALNPIVSDIGPVQSPHGPRRL